MINNVSSHHNHTLIRSPGSALSRSGARLLLHTAASLSLAGPRRAASGGRSKRRTAVPTDASRQDPHAYVQQRTHSRRHTRVRVRGSAGSTERTAGEPSSGKTGKKARKQQPSRPAGGRTGSTPSTGNRRLPQEPVSEDFTVAKPGYAGRNRRHTLSCSGAPIPLGQHNFSRIHDDLSGCYKLVDNVVLNQQTRLPIGNQSHPFTGSLDGVGHTLGVDLVRSMGDAVLFGAIDHSRIHLAVVAAHLETHNGSRAALIGEMGEHNQVVLSQLQGCIIKATGEGTVEAGLVASTRGADNRLDLYSARSNQLEARAFPLSQGCDGSCRHKAVVSLGLGVVRSGPERRSENQPLVHQTLIQKWLEDNDLQAWAGYDRAGSAGSGSRAEASAGLLGLLGDPLAVEPQLHNWQRQVHNNRILAHAQDQRGSAEKPGAGGHSCASLGYGAVRCQVTDSVATRVPWLAGEWVQVWQTACTNNSVRAWSGPSPQEAASDTGSAQGGLARASLASVHPVRLLFVRHDAVGPGQLQALAGTGVAERALLGAAREAWVLLYAGGDAQLPLLGAWDGAINECRHVSVLDTAGYQLGDFNCNTNSNITRIPPDDLRHNSLQPWHWRVAHHSLFYSEFSSLSFKTVSCDGQDSALHYPHEVLQALAPSATEWWLVTRQHYPWQPENDHQGLVRVSRYLAPESTASWPQTQARASQDGLLLYQARPQDALLHDSRPVASLVQGSRLYQLYQGAGDSIQLISLAVNGADGHYSLTQYEGLAGSARLLSVENGELHLWVEKSQDILGLYGLGPEPLAASRRGLYQQFDLSHQSGNQTLLARAGDWLYSLRQEAGQPASLRRHHVATAQLDAGWQALWPGNVTDGLRLAVAYDRLTAVPLGALPDPQDPTVGLQARVPDAGGCLQWSRIALAHYPLPADSVAPTSGAPGFPASSPTGTAPGSSAETRKGSGTVNWPHVILGTTVAGGTLAACGGAAGGLLAACFFIARKRRRPREVVLEMHNIRQPDRVPIVCDLSEETAV